MRCLTTVLLFEQNLPVIMVTNMYSDKCPPIQDNISTTSDWFKADQQDWSICCGLNLWLKTFQTSSKLHFMHNQRAP